MNVNEKLLAACEATLDRLINIGRHHFPREYFETLEDAIAAARAQTEDDATPVDNEWADRNIPLTARSHDKNQFKARFTWTTHKDGRFVLWLNGEILSDATRGDVRRLLAALEVNLERA